MKKIKLTQGKYALVDDEDFSWLNQWRWDFDGRYARRREGGKKIYLHQVIQDNQSGKLIDHINRNKLDNRRANLRNVSPRINIINSKLRNTNKPGYKGIWFCKDRNKWQVSITVNYIKIHLGTFKELNDAIKVRKNAENKYVIL